MSLATAIKNIVSEELKSTHVAFLAEILTLNDDKNKAKIQPLGLIREYGGTAKKQAVLTNVHVAQSASRKFATGGQIEVGDIVLCICCDRNIDAALRGENSLPPVGCHNQSDCVIVAII